MRVKQFQVPLIESAVAPIPIGALEEEAYGRGFRCIAGLDEVGRGPLAGPVVAAAIVFPKSYRNSDIKDSKLLTATQREQLVSAIKRDSISWNLGIVEVDEIDRINILEASLLAMAKAVEGLRLRPDLLLIDGNQTIDAGLFVGHRLAGFLPQQKTIVKGDQLCLSIAAASILAKVARDELMLALDKIHPEYGFAGHKGYACASHLDALRRFGPSPSHRRSFKPVRDLCGESGADPSELLLFQRRL